MENIYSFRTNIKCNGCKSKVAAVLDASTAIDSWEVDLDSDSRKLTVKSSGLKQEDIIRMVAQAGYSADPRS